MITNLSFYIKDFLTEKVVGFAHTRKGEEGRGLCPHPLKKLFEKSFLRIFKNFPTNLLWLPSEGGANIMHPMEGSQRESFLTNFNECEHLHGKASATDGKVLPKEFRGHHPKFSTIVV